jgi:hypothetical protein
VAPSRSPVGAALSARPVRTGSGPCRSVQRPERSGLAARLSGEAGLGCQACRAGRAPAQAEPRRRPRCRSALTPGLDQRFAEASLPMLPRIAAPGQRQGFEAPCPAGGPQGRAALTPAAAAPGQAMTPPMAGMLGSWIGPALCRVGPPIHRLQQLGPPGSPGRRRTGRLAELNGRAAQPGRSLRWRRGWDRRPPAPPRCSRG